MKFRTVIWSIPVLLTVSLSTVAHVPPPAAPRVFLMDGAKLEQIKKKIQSNDKEYQAAVANFEQAAKKALAGGTYSVMSKTAAPARSRSY